MIAIGSTAAAQTPTYGPLMPPNGFPQHYDDGQGTALSLCLSNPDLCGLLASVAAPLDGVPFPANYSGTWPDECLYWLGEATMETNGGGEALLVMALSATFTNGVVSADDRTTFARLRLRVDNLVPGAIYHITHPYGAIDLMAERAGRRGINYTFDVGLLPTDFSVATTASHVFPFLRWDGDLPLVDAQGNEYVGDPNVLHRVTGSPTGNNLFRIEGPSVGGAGVNSIETDLFAIVGQLRQAAPAAAFTASRTSGPAPLPVAFQSQATGAIGSFRWDFGDGGSSSAGNPAHVYVQDGVYTVSLTVTGPGGSDTHTIVDMITVGDPAPALGAEVNSSNRLRFRVENATLGVKAHLLGSPDLGATPFRGGRCAIGTGLGSPFELATLKITDRESTHDFRVPAGLQGLTWHFQVVDPADCSITNVASVTF
ncbi:MAG: PKD domain-containing protein [Planctomycetota bacterium]